MPYIIDTNRQTNDMKKKLITTSAAAIMIASSALAPHEHRPGTIQRLAHQKWI